MAVETIGADLTASLGTLVTPSATANTKGGWTTLVASSGIDAKGILVSAINKVGSANGYLIDIGTGNAGAEVVIAGNFPLGEPATSQGAYYYFPLQIASGSRIAARCQVDAASAGGIRVMAYLLGAATNQADMTRTTTYGADTTDSGGTSIDPGGTAHTKGSYSEIVASTTNPIDWLMVALGNQNNAARQASSWLIDIATGGAGAESIVIANIHVASNTQVSEPSPIACFPFPVTIAAGTRIAARAQCTIIDATDRLLDIILIASDGSVVASGGGIRLVGHGGLAA